MEGHSKSHWQTVWECDPDLVGGIGEVKLKERHKSQADE